MTDDQPYRGDPWTIGTEIKMRDKPNVLMISLLTDEAGASLIARGIVPAYVKQQAKDALEWNCTEERTHPDDRPSLFPDEGGNGQDSAPR